MLWKKSLFAFPAILISFLMFFAFAGEAAEQLKITTPSPLDSGTDGAFYSKTLQAKGGIGSYNWVYPSWYLKDPSYMMPPGFKLDDKSGILSGTQSLQDKAFPVTYTFAIDVTDENGDHASKRFEITINSTDIPQGTGHLKITSPSPLKGRPDEYLSYPFTATDDGEEPYKWTGSNLPAGFLLNPEGLFYGTPTITGSFGFTVKVDDASRTYHAEEQFVLEVSSLQISPEALPEGKIKENYSQTISVSGGTPPYNWTVISKPSWLTPVVEERSDREMKTMSLSGTPPSSGDFPLSIKIQDSSSPAAMLPKDFQIKITGDDSGAGSRQENLEIDWPPSPISRTALTVNTDITELVKYVYEWGISLGGFAAFIILVIAGFQYLTSVGDPGKMKDAINRIKEAGIGLGLLFGSVLILNTINPQLTKLSVPEFPKDSKAWDVKFTVDLQTEKPDCKAVILYASTDFQTLILNLKDPYKEENVYREIGSLKIDGNCQLTLYRLANYKTDGDNPPIIISGDGAKISDMSIYGETKFRSLKIIELQAL